MEKRKKKQGSKKKEKVKKMEKDGRLNPSPHEKFFGFSLAYD